MRTNRMSKRKLLALILAVGILSASGGAGTYAYLSDSGTTEVSFLTGSLDVVTTPNTLDFEEDNGDNMTAKVNITNEGSLDAGKVEWSQVSVSGSNDVARAMEIKTVSYRSSGITSSLNETIGDKNNNGIFDLDDIRVYLDNSTINLEDETGGGVLSSGETVWLFIEVEIDYSQPGITEDNMKMTAVIEITGTQVKE